MYKDIDGFYQKIQDSRTLSGLKIKYLLLGIYHTVILIIGLIMAVVAVYVVLELLVIHPVALWDEVQQHFVLGKSEITNIFELFNNFTLYHFIRYSLMVILSILILLLTSVLTVPVGVSIISLLLDLMESVRNSAQSCEEDINLLKNKLGL